MARRSRKAKIEAPPAQSLFKLSTGGDPQRYEAERRSKYRLLFNTLLGREVLADFLSACGVFSQDGAHQGDVANHRNGARWAGFEILRAMGVDDADAQTRAILNDDVTEFFHEDE